MSLSIYFVYIYLYMYYKREKMEGGRLNYQIYLCAYMCTVSLHLCDWSFHSFAIESSLFSPADSREAESTVQREFILIL